MGSEIPAAETILFCNSNFVRKLRKFKPEITADGQVTNMHQSPDAADLIRVLRKVNESDIVIVPFFFDEDCSQYSIREFG